VFFVPALTVIGLCIHIWRVRKDGFAIADRRRGRRATTEVVTEAEEVSVDA
jgi:hypothetical protein